MKLARKQLITALLSMAAAGALAAPAMAQQGTFGGMPTVTPQSQLEAQKKQAAKKKSSSRKRKLPAYVVVDKGGPNAGLYDEADDSYDNDVSRARYTSINEAIKNVACCLRMHALGAEKVFNAQRHTFQRATLAFLKLFIARSSHLERLIGSYCHIGV